MRETGFCRNPEISTKKWQANLVLAFLLAVRQTGMEMGISIIKHGEGIGNKKLGRRIGENSHEVGRNLLILIVVSCRFEPMKELFSIP